jgi:predicted helicase
VKKDDRSGIVSDPNQYSDDPQYIVNLIGRVTQVSLETMRLIAQLPEL